jgi:hypothetical protein
MRKGENAFTQHYPAVMDMIRQLAFGQLPFLGLFSSIAVFKKMSALLYG